MRKLVTGDCPESGRQQTITVTIEQPRGTGIAGSKVMGYACQYMQENRCKSCGDNGRDCPLYKKARAMFQ